MSLLSTIRALFTAGRAVLGHATASLRLYHDLYGPYPYLKLEVVEAPLVNRGMEYTGLPFSGEFDFAQTQYMFQTTHMVAPKEKSLSCTECHSGNGRLAKLGGFYMPGRDGNKALNVIGWGSVIVALIAVLGHGAGRLVSRKRREKKNEQRDDE